MAPQDDWWQVMRYAIQAEGLVKRYGETSALDGVDLAVPPGTAARRAGAQRRGQDHRRAHPGDAAAGRTRAGPRSAGYDVAEQAHQVRSLIGLTGQYAAVDEMLTGVENLVMIGRLLGLPRAEARRGPASCWSGSTSTDAGGRAAKTYSGGMRRRLDLAASLVGRPQVLFLDEPTTGLDPRSRTELWDVVRGLMADGVTVLLTTQYLEEADQLADDIVVFDHGRVIATGTSDELKATTGGAGPGGAPGSSRTSLDLVADVVADVLGDRRPRSTGGLVTAPVHDPAVVPAIVRRLDDARRRRRRAGAAQVQPRRGVPGPDRPPRRGRARADGPGGGRSVPR